METSEREQENVSRILKRKWQPQMLYLVKIFVMNLNTEFKKKMREKIFYWTPGENTNISSRYRVILKFT